MKRVSFMVDFWSQNIFYLLWQSSPLLHRNGVQAPLIHFLVHSNFNTTCRGPPSTRWRRETRSLPSWTNSSASRQPYLRTQDPTSEASLNKEQTSPTCTHWAFQGHEPDANASLKGFQNCWCQSQKLHRLSYVALRTQLVKFMFVHTHKSFLKVKISDRLCLDTFTVYEHLLELV